MRAQRDNLQKRRRDVGAGHGVAVGASHRGVVQVLVPLAVRAGRCLGSRDLADVHHGAAPVIDRRAPPPARRLTIRTTRSQRRRRRGRSKGLVQQLRPSHRRHDGVVHRLCGHLRRERRRRRTIRGGRRTGLERRPRRGGYAVRLVLLHRTHPVHRSATKRRRGRRRLRAPEASNAPAEHGRDAIPAAEERVAARRASHRPTHPARGCASLARLADDLAEPRAVKQRVTVAEHLHLLVPGAQTAIGD